MLHTAQTPSPTRPPLPASPTSGAAPPAPCLSQPSRAGLLSPRTRLHRRRGGIFTRSAPLSQGDSILDGVVFGYEYLWPVEGNHFDPLNGPPEPTPAGAYSGSRQRLVDDPSLERESMIRFLSQVEKEHEERLDSAEKNVAIRRTLETLYDPDSNDMMIGRWIDGIEAEDAQLTSSMTEPPPVPHRHVDRQILPFAGPRLEHDKKENVRREEGGDSDSDQSRPSYSTDNLQHDVRKGLNPGIDPTFASGRSSVRIRLGRGSVRQGINSVRDSVSKPFRNIRHRMSFRPLQRPSTSTPNKEIVP